MNVVFTSLDSLKGVCVFPDTLEVVFAASASRAFLSLKIL